MAAAIQQAVIHESALEKAQGDLERIRELKSRISGMERTRLASRVLPTLPAFASLLPGGALQAGSVYSVGGSMMLVMGLLVAASATGAWCGVVGVPEFGVESAARFGVELGRLVLVREPGRAWLSVAAALADALTIVVVRPAGQVGEVDAARLAARLRQRGAVLISLLPEGAPAWPGSEATLAVVDSSWTGIAQGSGYLRERSVTVRAEVRGGRSRAVRLRLPGGSAPLEELPDEGRGIPVRALREEQRAS